MSTIDAMNLREIDLNLLVALRVLLAERHVTRAAEKLGVTQPAMSATLARLRAVFNDPLLVRGTKGMAWTPRAEQLIEQLEQTLAMISSMIALPAAFSPSTSQRTFTLIGTDFIEAILLPGLMEVMAMQAPQVQIVFKQPDPRHLENLMGEGEVDLAIGYLPQAPENLITRVLFKDTFACIARNEHPLISSDKMQLDWYTDLKHVQVLPRDAMMYASPIDMALGALGLVRQVAVWQPSFLAIPAVVAQTDLIGTLPKRLADYVSAFHPVKVYEPPMQLPEVDFALYWHARSHEDVGHKWLRETIGCLLRSN